MKRITLLCLLLFVLFPSAASAAGTLSWTPGDPYEFGEVRVGETSSRTYTFTNTGDADVVLQTFQSSGANNDQFSVAQDACFTPDATLAPGDSCSVEVTFSPTSPGNKSGTLQVNTVNAGTFFPWYRGEAVIKPFFTPTPSEHDFGEVNTGDAGSRLFTVKNGVETETGQDLEIGEVSLNGPGADQFEIASDTCSDATVEPQLQTCSVGVDFRPTKGGAAQASLVFPDNDGSPDTIHLLGTGVDVPRATPSPASHDFGLVILGSGATRSIDLGSNGTTALNVAGVTVSGADAGDFEVITDACTGQRVAISDTCSVSVRFAPTSAGAKAATLVFADDAPGATQSVSLAGTGGVKTAPNLTPITMITKRPKAKSKNRKARFAFRSSLPRSTFRCSIDGKKFRKCSSPVTYRLRPGRHLFRVRAISPAGKADPTPAIARFRILKK